MCVGGWSGGEGDSFWFVVIQQQFLSTDALDWRLLSLWVDPGYSGDFGMTFLLVPLPSQIPQSPFFWTAHLTFLFCSWWGSGRQRMLFQSRRGRYWIELVKQKYWPTSPLPPYHLSWCASFYGNLFSLMWGLLTCFCWCWMLKNSNSSNSSAYMEPTAVVCTHFSNRKT